MRTKLVFTLIFSLFFNLTICYSQVKNCNLTFLDSNNVKQDYSDVNLLSFDSDILTISKSFSIHKLHLKDIKALEFLGSTNSPRGLLIGAAVGLSLGIAAVIALSGGSFHGSSDKGVNPLAVIGGGLVLALIGGLIGGSIHGTYRENVKVDFSELSLKQARIRIQNILKFYGSSE